MISSVRLSLTVLITLCFYTANAQLTGAYTINSGQPTGGTNFQTFNAFADSINSVGISGNILVSVVAGSGPYNEQVVFNTIPGADSASTVTLDGNGETITAITDATNRHIIRLSNVQYFTINNLHIAWNPVSSGGFYGVHIYNTGNHITISNCSVDLTGTTSTLYGAYIVSGSLTSILDSGIFHDINIVNDTANGGGYGASVYGTGTNLATNIVISGNTFYDFHSNGIYLRETDGAEISRNHFDKRTAQITSCNAIQIAQAKNINAKIFENNIQLSQTNNGTVSFRGIYLFNGTGHKVYNNVIHDVKLVSGNFTGIEVRTAATAPEIFYNTISIDNPLATTGDLFGISEELSNTNSVLRNNLISISQPTSGLKAGLTIGAIATPTTALNSDYNIIWVPGGNVAAKTSLTPVLYGTLAMWQTVSTMDANSHSLDPLFISSTLPQPTNILADNLGTPMTGFTTDILGITRGVIPDIGAYEFSGTSGIESTLNSSGFIFYPNPFSNELNISLKSGVRTEIVLYDATGRIQLREEFSDKISIDTKKLAAGIYFYVLTDRNGLVSEGKVVRE